MATTIGDSGLANRLYIEDLEATVHFIINDIRLSSIMNL